MHILVIEDEAQLCSSIAEGLRLDGYEVDTCMDGNEGLDLCLTEPFDLILLDLNLPGMDGLSILQQLRAENSSTPVIILLPELKFRIRWRDLILVQMIILQNLSNFEELEARIRSLTRRKFIQENICLTCGRISLTQKQDLPRLIICHFP